MYTIIVKEKDLVEKDSCEEWLDLFRELVKLQGREDFLEISSVMEYIKFTRDYPEYIGWAVEKGIIPAFSAPGINLSNVHLSGANLSLANLRGTNLSRADLSGTNLSCANLSYSDLSCADLSHSDLSGANLSLANLRSADFRGAN